VVGGLEKNNKSKKNGAGLKLDWRNISPPPQREIFRDPIIADDK
jgi:hypothetical protein